MNDCSNDKHSVKNIKEESMDSDHCGSKRIVNDTENTFDQFESEKIFDQFESEKVFDQSASDIECFNHKFKNTLNISESGENIVLPNNDFINDEKSVSALQIQVKLLKKELDESETFRANLVMENKKLIAEIQSLKNDRIDNEYENGFFVEDDVLKRIEEENHKLKIIANDIYQDISKVWYELIKKKIRDL